jgi:hypothetical protein
VAVLEYFGHFGTTVRTILFYAFLAANTAILVRFIAMPLLSLYELRKTLSFESAAAIIGQHFSSVKDKLLNTLQLHDQAETQMDPRRRELIEASIGQKIEELRPVPFVKAVDYRTNRRYVRYIAVPVLVLFILLITAPNMLLESTQRLVQHTEYFEEKAPFEFVLKNRSLRGIRQQDYTVELKVKGQELPAEVYLVIDGNPYRMSPDSKTDFNYTLKNLQKNLEFQFNANGFTSKPYELKVLPRPVLQKFDVKLNYPGYLGKQDEILQNVGDLTIPAGTRVTWRFYTEHTDAIALSFKGKEIPAERKGDNVYTYQARFLQDDVYFLKASNEYLNNADSIQYNINVIPDAYPSITVEQAQDSMNLKQVYFTGEVSDDYGFNRLTFNYKFTKTDDSAKVRMPERSQSIGISHDKLLQAFFYEWDLGNLNIGPGDEVEYYFEVWDNDGVTGSKHTRSQRLFFKAPSLEEIEKNTEANNKQLENKMETAMKQARQLQKDMQDARMKLLDKKTLDWQDKKAIDDILKKQDKLQRAIEEIKKEYKENLEQQNEFKQMDKELLEKHEKMQELMNEVLDEETKKMLEELRKLLEESNKDQLQKQLDEMKFNDKEVQKELDRMMELFKQLQFEQKLEETLEKLDKLSEEQEKLSEESDKKNADSEQLKEKQEELNKKFDDIQKDLDELEQKNNELEQKNEMQETEKQEQEIDQEMEKSQQNLENNQNKKASQSQKNAAQKMKQMSKDLKAMQQQMEQEAQAEDIQSLRQILENLVYVSLEQEKLMEDFKTVNQYSPEYVDLAQRQRKLKDDAKLIEDSLLALSKRVMEIRSYVNKEIGEINFNMDKSLEALGDRNTPKSRSHQQFAMTSLNNLALMLSESLENMQQQMQQMQCNGPNCKPKKEKKPGKGQMQKMRQMQEQLSKQLEEMKNQMKNGQKQGREGQKMSEELARMAAQQEAIRRELQRINEELNKDGNKKLGDLDKVQDMMDKNEEDIVNKRITDETMKRQQEIMVRMLEAENAEKKQDFEEKRESKSGEEKKNPNPPLLDKYLRAKEKETELLRTVPASLNPYYREKVKEYFQGLQ